VTEAEYWNEWAGNQLAAAKRAANKNMNYEELEIAIPFEAIPYHYRVGSWMWVEFPEKPAENIRRSLYLLGFFWNKKRNCWCHACGVPSHGSASYDPRLIYEVEYPADSLVGELQEAA
jgi:hypothetical protein